MGARSKTFEEVKVSLYKKDKEYDQPQEFGCYVDSNRNIAVLLDSTALMNESNSKQRNRETPNCVGSTLYFKQAKHFMKKKKYEKALNYLQLAIGLSSGDDFSEEDAVGLYMLV